MLAKNALTEVTVSINNIHLPEERLALLEI
jgi:hypothetical protein